MAPFPPPRRRYALAAGITVWLSCVTLGMGLLTHESTRPGVDGARRAAWPPDSGLELGRDHPTLVMVLHPHCACSRASIGELARLMTRLQGQLDAYALFIRPQGIQAGWEQTDLWDSAGLIPGVRVVADPGGVQAARFGARTSGQVYVYGPEGDLQFAGGITPSRAHMGDSTGRDRIIALVEHGAAGHDHASVFGCPLVPSQDEFLLADLRRPETNAP